MIRKGLILPLVLAACSSSSGEKISSMNYLQSPIDATCARNAVIDEDGFAASTSIKNVGGAQQFKATFNQDLMLTIIVRKQEDGAGEVSVFAALDEDATPLDRRKTKFAVSAADEAIYRQCTTDGQINPDDSTVVLETQE